MDRRRFLLTSLAGALAAPLAAGAQRTGTVPRIGVLTLSVGFATPTFQAFRQGLRDQGYVEGQNATIEFYFADGRPDRLRDMATELVQRKSM